MSLGALRGVGGPIRFRGSIPEVLYMPAIVPEELKTLLEFSLHFQTSVSVCNCLPGIHMRKVDLVSLRVLA